MTTLPVLDKRIERETRIVLSAMEKAENGGLTQLHDALTILAAFVIGDAVGYAEDAMREKMNRALRKMEDNDDD